MSTKIRGEQLDLTDVLGDLETSLDGIYLRRDGAGAMNASAQLLLDDGSTGVPALAFSSDPDTGIFTATAGVLSISANNVKVVDISGNQVNITGSSARLTVSDGQIRASSTLNVANSPAYAFVSDTNTGFFSPSADDIGVGLGGFELFRFEGGDATSATNGVFHLYEAGINGTNSIALQSPDAITTSRTWTLPQDDPTAVAGQFLTTDASGVLSFAAAGTLSNVVEDTTPQLGGDLDVNDFDILGKANPGSTGGALTLQGGSGTAGGSVDIYGGVGTSTDGAIQLHAAQIHLRPSTGVHSGLRPELMFFDTDASHHVRLKAPSVVTTNRAWELPQDDPTTVVGYFLTTNAGGALSFSNTLASPVLTGIPQLPTTIKAGLSALGAGLATEPVGSTVFVTDDAGSPTFILAWVDGTSTWVRSDTGAAIS